MTTAGGPIASMERSRLRAGRALLLGAPAVSPAGCGVGITRFNELMSEGVRARATFDFNCPDGVIRVAPIDGRTFGAVGCGHRATYLASPPICNPDNVTESGVERYCSAVLNSYSVEAAVPSPVAPPPPPQRADG